MDPRRPPEGVLYEFSSKVMPFVTETIEIANQVRVRLMGIHKKIAGGSEFVSPRFSGKDRQGRPLRGHQHAYILPFDGNSDGRIDRILVACRGGFDESEQAALGRLTTLRGPDYEARCILVDRGQLENLCGPACLRLVSITPFVPARHYRRGRGMLSRWLEDELRRECRNHDVQQPISLHMVPSASCAGRSFHWMEFRRNRKGDDFMMGYGFRIQFREPIAHPIALGYGAHFGLGQFRPSEE